MATQLIEVKEQIGSEFAETPECGDEVFNKLHSLLLDPKTRIILSFNDIEVITTLFLHHSIAPIFDPKYKDLKPDERVRVTASNSLVKERIASEIKEAKKYFLNQAAYEEAYATEVYY